MKNFMNTLIKKIKSYILLKKIKPEFCLPIDIKVGPKVLSENLLLHNSIVKVENNEIIKCYNKNDKIVYFKRSDGYEEWLAYDILNRLVYVKNSKGFEIWYEYDFKNNITYYEDTKGVKIYRRYDNNGEVIFKHSVISNY